ncbi:hypothetical protein [Phytohabitans rumicis]|uniref:Lipoprotein n=1 Tax=Phytohabitans rumicis TaxID=1076125 RepID=A0A6V8LC65_9ACTN|nr:hypothetical protein [Phytohabitans rumicis]GFJ90275.1 hypothetical protein Prum_039170 [Phytohabitans rumicis]
MKGKLLRGAVAAILAATIGATGAVQPAQAANPPCEYVVCPDDMPPAGPMVDFVFAVFNLIKGGASAANIHALIQVVLAASSQATNEVIVHIDSYAAEAARSAAISASRDFADFDQIRQDDLVLDQWAREVGHKATDVKGMLNAVEDRRAADQMGHAVHKLYPIGLTGYEFAGLRNSYASLLHDYIEVTDKIIRDLAPVCSYSDVPLAPPSMWVVERHHTCTAADGKTATGVETLAGGVAVGEAVNLDQLKVDAARDSSWLVAVRIRPTLTS